MFRLGFIINPLAGLGGRVALKGSDGLAAEALARGARPEAESRARACLEVLQPYRDRIAVYTGAGAMGENLAKEMGFTVAGVTAVAAETSPEDTRRVAQALRVADVDLLVFAGGDGTARDVCSAVGASLPVLGIPAGVKIHSGVYAITPRHAGEVIAMLLRGELVDVREAAVMDIDEASFRAGVVKARRYGEMLVPEEGRFVQSVKSGGVESEPLVLADIAAEVVDGMEPDRLYLIGSGTTCAAVMEHLGLANTLLGIDAVLDGRLLAADLSEQGILELLDQYPKAAAILTIIGGQGHVLGRGNQQFSPRVVRRLGRENLVLIATKTKLKGLAGRPLLVDTGDAVLDSELSHYAQVITGYRDRVLYALGFDAGEPGSAP